MTAHLRQNIDKLTVPAARPVAATETAIKGGIARGTLILTAKGEVPIETLKAGDRIITRERGMSVLRGVTTHVAPACSVRTDSLSFGRPERDTTLACDQHITLRDWRAEALFDGSPALVPAHRLADGKQITTCGDADIFRLQFDTPLTIYANSLETPVGRIEAGVVAGTKPG